MNELTYPMLIALICENNPLALAERWQQSIGFSSTKVNADGLADIMEKVVTTDPTELAKISANLLDVPIDRSAPQADLLLTFSKQMGGMSVGQMAFELGEAFYATQHKSIDPSVLSDFEKQKRTAEIADDAQPRWIRYTITTLVVLAVVGGLIAFWNWAKKKKE